MMLIIVMEENEITTITIKKGTRDRLLEIGRFQESWDDLLNRLIDNMEDKKIETILESKTE